MGTQPLGRPRAAARLGVEAASRCRSGQEGIWVWCIHLDQEPGPRRPLCGWPGRNSLCLSRIKAERLAEGSKKAGQLTGTNSVPVQRPLSMVRRAGPAPNIVQHHSRSLWLGALHQYAPTLCSRSVSHMRSPSSARGLCPRPGQFCSRQLANGIGLHRGSRSYFEPPLVCLRAACIRSSRSLHREGLADQRHFAADRELSRGLMKAPSFLLTVRCAVSTSPYRPTRLRWWFEQRSSHRRVAGFGGREADVAGMKVDGF